MTTEVITQALAAGVQATYGQGRIWYLKTASSPINLRAESAGTGAVVRNFNNIAAGAKFVADPGDGWTYLRVTSQLAQTIEIVVGDDDVSFSNAVSIVGTPPVSIASGVGAGGSVVVLERPGASLAAPADVVLATATALSIAANGARQRITIGSLSTNTGNVRVQPTGAGAGKGLELQPGTYVGVPTTAAIDVRNDSGANQTIWQLEET